MKTPLAMATGAVGAAFGSMLCCTGPLVAASMGLSGAVLATFLPYRPLFVLLAVALLYAAFRRLDVESCAESACSPTSRGVRRLVWLLSALSVALLTSPLWDDLFFRT